MLEMDASSDSKCCNSASVEDQVELQLEPECIKGWMSAPGSNVTEGVVTGYQNRLADGESCVLDKATGHHVALASHSIPARWQLARSESDRAAVERQFGNEVEIAIGTLLAQLPAGAALTVDYVVEPAAGGAMRLDGRLGVEVVAGASSTVLEKALRTTLGEMSDYYAFSFGEATSKDVFSNFGEPWVVRPMSIDFRSMGGIGFMCDASGPAPIVRLPAIDASRFAAEKSRDGFGSAWPTAIRRVFKGALAIREAFGFRIRICRELIDREAVAALSRIMADAVLSSKKVDAGTNWRPAMSSYSAAMVDTEIEIWKSVSPIAVRIELTACFVDERNDSLLRMLAAEIFPSRIVEIVPAADASRGKAQANVIDLSDLFSLAAGSPPVLPHPEVLELMGYRRHLANPAVELANKGVLLGMVPVSGFEHPVRLAEVDRSRHCYMIGGTGSGKSTLLYNMIRADMEAGLGVGIMDPANDLFEQVLATVPSHRIQDVVIIDPGDPSMNVSLNPLDLGNAPDAHRASRVANALIDIFDAIYDMKVAGGPGFESCFRNTIMLAATARHDQEYCGLPKGPPTLMTAVEVLRNEAVRDRLLRDCRSSFLGPDFGGEVVGFFESFKRQRGDQALENWVPYVTSKLTRFLANPLLRRMFCAPHRTINFREILDDRKILLVNLDKGRVGEQDARMLGMLLLKAVFEAACSRSDIPREERVPFSLFLDEFQNVITPEVASALAEVRKFGLNLTLAHQTLSQLRSDGSSRMVSAVLGNCASKIVFRLGLDEAQVMESAFLPRFDAMTIAQLPDYQAVARLLVNNRPSQPFAFRTLPAQAENQPDTGVAEAARKWSGQKYSTKIDPVANSNAGGTEGIAPHAVEETQRFAILNGLAVLVPGIKRTGKDIPAIVDSVARAQERWHRHSRQVEADGVVPLAGRFFWTANHSLVLIISVNGDGAARAMVITGGHGEKALKGECPGCGFGYTKNGFYSGDTPLAELLGMDLVASADIRFEDEQIFLRECDHSSDWVFSDERLSGELTAGFYETHNGSVVYVSGAEIKGPFRYAWVCRGGHSVANLLGACVFEQYKFTLAGQFEISADKAAEYSAIVCARAAGMSLARRIWLCGSDIPVGWPEAVDYLQGALLPATLSCAPPANKSAE